MTDPIRIVLIDDHTMVREALVSVLEDEHTIEIVGFGGSRREAVQQVREQRPDVVVLDYNMPNGGALEILEDFARLGLDPKVLVLTVHENMHYAVRALEAGANGFLVKSSAVEELVQAIHAVRSGELYITPSLSRHVIDQLRRPRRERIGVGALSSREFELLRVMARGLGIKEVASTLKISVSSASTYRARVLKKLGLGSTGDLIRFALENHLVE